VTDTGDDARRDDEEIGGRSPIRILVRVGHDVAPAFVSLADAVAAHTNGAIEAIVTVQPSAPARAFLAELTAGAGLQADVAPDVLILSLADDIDVWAASPEPSGAPAAAEWREVMRAICEYHKSAGVRVLVCNASTVVPDDHLSSYHAVPEPPSVFANRLDSALIELSVDHGISIIDVDGIVGELGAEVHVADRLTYSVSALDAIRADLVRVLDDYGFFHPRPLLPQRGRRAA
jgi:hypothetical protein